MSRATFTQGVLDCLENAETWIEEAEILAKRGSFGHATALLIHGIEAIAQTWICFAVARGSVKSDDPSVKEYFKKHDIKLDFFTANVLIHDTIKDFTINHLTDDDYWNLNFLPLFNYYENKQEEMNEKRAKYPKELMLKRNRGIYVDFDFNKKEFRLPKEIEEKDYIKLKEESEIMFTTIFTLINKPPRINLSEL